ncbi:MAG: hypothetical protein WCP68_09790, partial [Enhydrobacter sp.]
MALGLAGSCDNRHIGAWRAFTPPRLKKAQECPESPEDWPPFQAGLRQMRFLRNYLENKKPRRRSPRSRAFWSASDRGYCLAVSDGTPVGAGLAIGVVGAP